jgi:hypothetical protein
MLTNSAGSPQAEEGAMVREAVYHSLGASAALVVRVRGASAGKHQQRLLRFLFVLLYQYQ